MKLTGVVLTKNEEKNISGVISNLKFCDEIIVIDDNSSDLTVKIAKKQGAKVFSHALNNDFSTQRNFGLEKAKGNWVLFVDADEKVSKALKGEILEELNRKNNTNFGYMLKRSDHIFGKTLKHGESGNIRILRLARITAGKWQREIHEEWKVIGRVSNLKNPLMHYPHPTISEFIKDINFYSSLHASANFKERKRSTIFKTILFPKLKFFKNYFLKLGILDGPQGFMVSMMMSLHSYLSWSKLWILQKRRIY